MTDLPTDIKKLVDQLDGFPAASRDAIISELNARASERKANAMRVPLENSDSGDGGETSAISRS